MKNIATHIVEPDEQNQRLDRFVRNYYPQTPLARLHKAIRKGEIRIDRKKAEVSTKLQLGQILELPQLNPNPQKLTINQDGHARKIDFKLASALEQHIIYDDRELMILNKPPGLAVQGGTSIGTHLDGALPALIQISEHYRLGMKGRLVHRLDKDTSGIMIIAKTGTAAKIIAEAFKEREIQKLYWAICVGVPSPSQGSIILRLSKEMGRSSGQERMEIDEENGQFAHTDYDVLDQAADKLSLIALYPKTGRTHQLRVHLAAIGTPILGDGKYGGYLSFMEDEILADSGEIKLHLHAKSVMVPAHLPLISAGKTFEASLFSSFQSSLDHYGLNG